MIKTKLKLIFQIMSLVVFGFMATASASSSGSSSKGTDWGSVARSTAIGGAAGYNGMDLIGNVSSNSDAMELARSKGYSEYWWDTNSGNVYAK